MSKIPFGFRQDPEPEPEPDPDDKHGEISNTAIQTSLTWTPVVRPPCNSGDSAPRHPHRPA